MNTCRKTVRNASMVVLAAGLAMPALAQMETRQKDREHLSTQPEQRTAQGEQVKRLSMHRASDLIGTEVRNASDDSLGSIDDVIVDRGSGKISHIVVQFGDILGLGGQRVAIPFEVFAYDAIDRDYSLTMSSDDLDRMAENTPANWIALDSGNLESQLRSIGESTRQHTYDMYTDAFGGNPEPETIQGKVIGINRWNEQDGTEYISVDIQPNDSNGETRTIVLGPSWYVMGNDSAPMQSHNSTIRAVPLGDNQNRMVALGYGADGNEFELRNSDGTPSWNSTQNTGSAVMLSDVLGRDANARSDKGGEIQDALIEANSGMVPVLLFDPNENVLGLGDELYCVPWSESAIGTEIVRLDADLDMLSACETSPEDIETLTTRESIEHIYKPFDAEVTKFTVREHRQWNSGLRTTRDSNRGG